MQQTFWKMHGAGNDFILMDDRCALFPCADAKLIQRLCNRHTGIGSEGLLLIQASTRGNFRMRFFNPDGCEAEMCGNGARCIARLAHDLGIAPAEMQIESASGILQAEVAAGAVRLYLPAPRNCQCHQVLALDNQTVCCHTINTGVPHAVIETKDLDNTDVDRIGAALRYHGAFAPQGTNVDFMAVIGAHALRVRTYERGVEAETPACGTGITACALIAGRLGRVTPPVQVTCAHGDTLTVNYQTNDDGRFASVTLLGPAAYVFEGKLKA